MKYRKLRIAWSAMWGVVALLLIGLWVRSDRKTDSWRFGTHTVDVTRGWIEVDATYQQRIVALGSTSFAIRHQPGDRPICGTVIPVWLVTLSICCVAAVAWLPYRFSLRTFLIATTLVAVGLGIIVWAAS